MRYDHEFWGGPEMTPRIYVMWALGNLAVVLVALACVLRPVAYVRDVAVAIWQDAQVQDIPAAPAVQIREPGWVLREYKERMRHEHDGAREGLVVGRVQGGLPGRVVRCAPIERAFTWPA